ncbi:MAG: NADH-quinone oxidoreductase subunit NuoG [Pseudomonadota bacterium]
MATIHVDGKSFEVNGADNLLEACLSLGLDIPYFCWHPALGSVGACRQCAVKQYADANDTRGRLVMSCMTPATDNTFIAIEDVEAQDFRKSVIEWLMTNHPHDCPVCEEGGHCHLQDMTVMTGHNTRRYRFEKRTHVNQYLGPFLNHEMNRCIACYRCDRYYKDYAGGTDFGVFGAHDNVYFGRAEDGVLESEFSGNLTEVCPTGVFTDQTHSDQYTRKWDMQYAPSVCQNCSVGCNISPGERYGEIRRIENRYNGSVNHYFLCDRGRFGYGFVNREDRPIAPLLQGQTEALTIDSALDYAADVLQGAKKIMGIGSPRASLETNFALASLVGAGNFSSGINAEELALNRAVYKVLKNTNVPNIGLRDIEKADAVFILGEDITQTAPRVALAVRQAVKSEALKLAVQKKVADWNALSVKNIVQHDKSPVFIASVCETRLDDIATSTVRSAVNNLARIGFAVAHAIDAAAPAVNDLTDEEQTFVQTIAQSLLAADKPLIISGTGLQSIALIEAAANIATALKNKSKDVGIALTLLECNSLGVTLMEDGQAEYPAIETVLNAVSKGDVDTLIIAENDLYRRASKALVDAAFAKAKTIIVLDHQATETTKHATLVLPAASFAEGDGTIVNMEGRAQRYFQVYDANYYNAKNEMREGWRWLHALQSTIQKSGIRWTHIDDVIIDLASKHPALARISEAAPNAKFRIHGLKIAREPRRYSGRTAMRANISVHEPRASQDADSALAFSMEGITGAANSSQLIPFAYSTGWHSPQAWNKFQDEVGGHLTAGDPGIRLIEPTNSAATYFQKIPSAASGLHSVSLYHLYGSDEQSSRAPVVAEQIPTSYIALSTNDAQTLHFADGEIIAVHIGDVCFQAPLKISANLAQGVVGIPVLNDIPFFTSNHSIQLQGGAV